MPEGTTRGGRPEAPERVGDMLPSVFDKLGVTKEIATQDALLRWHEVVGERIAAVTHAKSVANGVLFVEVRSSAWINELNLMRREILARLNAGQGQARVDRVVFTLSEAGQGMERGGQDR